MVRFSIKPVVSFHSNSMQYEEYQMPRYLSKATLCFYEELIQESPLHHYILLYLEFSVYLGCNKDVLKLSAKDFSLILGLGRERACKLAVE